jgi:hypothetical protein
LDAKVAWQKIETGYAQRRCAPVAQMDRARVS